jgi:single-strand DNA-binding protein
MMFLDSNRQGGADMEGFNQKSPGTENLDQTRQEQPAGPAGPQSGPQQSSSGSDDEETFEPDDDLPF